MFLTTMSSLAAFLRVEMFDTAIHKLSNYLKIYSLYEVYASKNKPGAIT